MARIKWTEEKIAERAKAGYGLGQLDTYKPWLTVQDLSSQGRSRRVFGHKTQRMHAVFSDIEYRILVACEWSPQVIDIREQYPLDRALTQSIAQTLGIKHPYYPGTHVPTVMTADFLLTCASSDGKQHFIALNAKATEEAEDETSLCKLEIQRSYFEQQSIPHHIIFSTSIPTQKINNYAWIMNARLKPQEVEPSPGYFTHLMMRMKQGLLHQLPDSSLKDYCAEFDGLHGADPGTGLRVAKLLMLDRILLPILDAANLEAMPMTTFVMASTLKQHHIAGGFDVIC